MSLAPTLTPTLTLILALPRTLTRTRTLTLALTLDPDPNPKPNPTPNPNPTQVYSIGQKLQSLLSQRPELKLLAQRAFVNYVRSVQLQADKRVFDPKAS